MKKIYNEVAICEETRDVFVNGAKINVVRKLEWKTESGKLGICILEFFADQPQRLHGLGEKRRDLLDVLRQITLRKLNHEMRDKSFAEMLEGL